MPLRETCAAIRAGMVGRGATGEAGNASNRPATDRRGRIAGSCKPRDAAVGAGACARCRYRLTDAKPRLRRLRAMAEMEQQGRQPGLGGLESKQDSLT